jgi:hypothetical protein
MEENGDRHVYPQGDTGVLFIPMVKVKRMVDL